MSRSMQFSCPMSFEKKLWMWLSASTLEFISRYTPSLRFIASADLLVPSVASGGKSFIFYFKKSLSASKITVYWGKIFSEIL